MLRRYRITTHYRETYSSGEYNYLCAERQRTLSNLQLDAAIADPFETDIVQSSCQRHACYEANDDQGSLASNLEVALTFVANIEVQGLERL